MIVVDRRKTHWPWDPSIGMTIRPEFQLNPSSLYFLLTRLTLASVVKAGLK